MTPTEATAVARSAEMFITTHWSVVYRAAEVPSPESRQALEHLCATYYLPLFTYVRRYGHNVADAQDRTQQFFAHLLEHNSFKKFDRNRGRFRTFLLTSLKHFLINEWKRERRIKNGGGLEMLSLDEEKAGAHPALEPSVPQAPDELYDRSWAAVVLERALKALRAEFEQDGKKDLFERLKVYVWGEKNSLSYGEMAEQLGMSEGAVKVSVHRLRQRYGEMLRSEVAQTVLTPGDLEEELRYLVSIIRNGAVIAG